MATPESIYVWLPIKLNQLKTVQTQCFEYNPDSVLNEPKALGSYFDDSYIIFKFSNELFYLRIYFYLQKYMVSK